MSRHHKRKLNSRRWRILRRAVLRKAGWRCSCGCGRYANEVDHVVPLHRGGDAWSPSNLQALARSCHIRKTARENQKEIPPEVLAWRARVAELLAE